MLYQVLKEDLCRTLRRRFEKLENIFVTFLHKISQRMIVLKAIVIHVVMINDGLYDLRRT